MADLQVELLIIMPLLTPQDNFADLREIADKLLSPATDDTVKRLIAVVGKISYRCDLLEREVERLERLATGKSG